ncbi:MAG: trigger factor [Pseudomonadota bacterium]
MQVTETKSEGLKREYSLVVTAADLEAKTEEKLKGLSQDVQMPGFRKGKVPLALLKQRFGKSVMGEVIQETVEGSVAGHLEESGHRPARQPDIKIANEDFQDGDDLNVEIAYEMLPDVPDLEFGDIALERKTVEVTDEAIDEALSRLAQSATDFEAAEEGTAAEDGDQAVIDFIGRVDGETFEGGEAEDFPLVLGSGSFIPGFEDQVMGAKTGDKIDVKVTFPEEYGAEHLAGKDAVFEVTVKEVKKPKPAEIDDALAERFNAENLEQLREQISTQIGQEFSGASRALVKRRLLDRLDELVTFELPESLVEIEASSIAQQLWNEENPDADGQQPAEVAPTDEHKSLAERRVRLGLLLAEIGSREKVEISDGDLGQAIMAQARQYPGQEREFFEFVKSNREALEQIRAPLFEDKVVDAVLAKAAVTDVPVTKEELEAEIEALDAESEGESKAG